MDPYHHRYPHGVHLSALNERNSRRVWSDDASDAGEAAITNKNCSNNQSVEGGQGQCF